MWLEHKAGGPAVDDREQEDVSGHLWVKVGKINSVFPSPSLRGSMGFAHYRHP